MGLLDHYDFRSDRPKIIQVVDSNEQGGTRAENRTQFSSSRSEDVDSDHPCSSNIRSVVAGSNRACGSRIVAIPCIRRA
jgi:hypothetical protein